MKTRVISIVSPPARIANKQITQADLSILRKAKKYKQNSRENAHHNPQLNLEYLLNRNSNNPSKNKRKKHSKRIWPIRCFNDKS